MRRFIYILLKGLMSSGTQGMAEDQLVTVFPFGLYEQSPKPILVDGVSTKYGLGVLGAELRSNVSDQFLLSGKIGYGQNNDQDVSFSGANFNGMVRGSYLEGAGGYTFYATQSYTLFGEAKLINRALHAPDLKGTRNGLALTGKADTTIRTADALFCVKYSLAKQSAIKVSAGYTRWHLIADATGYFASNGITATARKKIDTIGHDPVFELSFETTQKSRSIIAKIASRSLHSKASTEILTAELIYQLSF